MLTSSTASGLIIIKVLLFIIFFANLIKTFKSFIVNYAIIMITISIIGSGKLSYNLSEAFISNKELRLNEIYSRNNKNIKLFNKKIKFTNKIDSLSEADFYFILTNDDSIEEISKKDKNKKWYDFTFIRN